MAWEGITAVPHPLVNGSTITVLGDQGYNYSYGHGVRDPTAKSLNQANWRESPVTQLTLTGAGQGGDEHVDQPVTIGGTVPSILALPLSSAADDCVPSSGRTRSNHTGVC